MTASVEHTHRMPILFFSVLQLFLCIMVLVLESSRCEYWYRGKGQRDMTYDSLNAIEIRSSVDWPVVAGVLETIVGLVIFARPRLVYQLVGVLPGVLVVSLCALRLRHVGLLGCFDGDDKCCESNFCPNATVSTEMPGCTNQTARIYWRDSDNYCPWPKWFNINRNHCNDLALTPDITWCFTYGCSYDATPIRYIFNRIWIVNLVLLLVCVARAKDLKDFL